MTRKFTPRFLDHAMQLIGAGADLKTAAATLCCHPDALSKALRARGERRTWGMGKRVQTRKDLPTQEIVESYLAGQSVKALAARYGVNRYAIYLRLSEQAVAIRNRSAAMFVRLQQLSDEQRCQLTRGANEAMRDCTPAQIERRLQCWARNAEARQQLRPIGPGELEFEKALKNAGKNPICQKAVGRYNVDFVVGSVAVELKYRGSGGFNTRNRRERSKKIIEAGYKLVGVYFADLEALRSSFDQIIAWLDLVDSKPAVAGKHWVIRCGFTRRTIPRNKSHNGTGIFSPPELLITAREINSGLA